MHGGISPELVNFNQIRRIERPCGNNNNNNNMNNNNNNTNFKSSIFIYNIKITHLLISYFIDVPDEGLLCDLLWADPDKEATGWSQNDRGVSVTFSTAIIDGFLKKHDLDLICRAHQVNLFLIRLLMMDMSFLEIGNL